MTIAPPHVRCPEPAEIPVLAALWHAGWHEAHAAHVPAELTAQRTLESFAIRLPGLLPATRVTGPPGAPTGICTIRDDELNQMFVSPAARGTAAAQALIADGEARLYASGIRRAWLGCVIGNVRAASFYKKCGWHNARVFSDPLDLVKGTYDLDVWRFEKDLHRQAINHS